MPNDALATLWVSSIIMIKTATMKSPERRCFAAGSAQCATSRTGRSPEPPENSSSLPHQPDEDVFERAFGRVQVAEPDSRAAEIGEQRRNSAALALAVIGVDQFAAVGRQGQMVSGKRRRNGIEPCVQMQRQLLLAELAHQLGLALNQNDL